jgi:hypothetical protein
MTQAERDRAIWPDVVASTKMGDDRRYFVEAQTNNNDAGMRIYIYWYTPEDGGQPYLVIEMDDEELGPEGGEINVRIRRNDGLVAEGTQQNMQYLKEDA